MIQKIKDIVREASKLMLTDIFEINEKDGVANIVTSSDVAVENYLKEKLAELLPGSGFLCEEEDEHNLGHEYTWIIDPIDGTANYARGIRECAICVGLRHNEDMAAAVVFLPRTGEMFWAERGKGAFLGDKQIKVSEREFKNSVLCTALAVYHKEHARVCSEIIVDAFEQINDIRRFGAAAPELCFLAIGRCELYFEYILSPWDFAAASLILEEAGGCLCDLDGKKLDPTKATGVIAANNPENLAKLLAIVKMHIF